MNAVGLSTKIMTKIKITKSRILTQMSHFTNMRTDCKTAKITIKNTRDICV
jgi:hypothetical protein